MQNRRILKFNSKNIIRILYQIVVLVFSFCLTACLENPELATVTTEVIHSTPSEVTVKVNIHSDGGSDIFQRGVLIGSEPNPAIYKGLQSNGRGSASFQIIFQVGEGMTNYFRAYAVNGAGVAYGNQIVYASIYLHAETNWYHDITGNSAMVNSNVSSNRPILARGVCWNTSTHPTTGNFKTNDGTVLGEISSQLTGLTDGTTYYARAYATNDTGIVYGEDIEFTTKIYPKVNTSDFINTGTFILAIGGEGLKNENQSLDAYGVCWSTSPSPTIADNKTADNGNLIYDATADSFSFMSRPPGLTPNTTYHFRAYASTSAGTVYGADKMITTAIPIVSDLDGNPYSAVTIGTQVWLVENLTTTKYANGDAIPQTAIWDNSTTGGWNYYNGDSQNNFPSGKLYNWFAVTDPRNVCPAGWHAPTDSEWTILENYLGGRSVAGGELKEIGNAAWSSPNAGATNSSGFTAVPGGQLNYGYSAQFWSNENSFIDSDWIRNLSNTSIQVERYGVSKTSKNSVRCVKN